MHSMKGLRDYDEVVKPDGSNLLGFELTDLLRMNSIIPHKKELDGHYSSRNRS